MPQSSYQFKVRRKERCAAAARLAGGGGGREMSRAAISQVDWMQQLMDGTLESLTVRALKEYLRANSLEVSGPKPELLARVAA
jgi:hypothetical protein